MLLIPLVVIIPIINIAPYPSVYKSYKLPLNTHENIIHSEIYYTRLHTERIALWGQTMGNILSPLRNLFVQYVVTYLMN